MGQAKMGQAKGRSNRLFFFSALILGIHQALGSSVFMISGNAIVIPSNSKFSALLAPKPVPSDLFDIEEARMFLALSNVAYCDSRDIFPSWKCPICVTTLKDFLIEGSVFDPDNDLHGYYGYWPSRNSIVVAFKGTKLDDVWNWIVNLDATLVPYLGVTGASVHQGFYTAYSKSLKGMIIEGVQHLLQKYPGASVDITGHSLGGAMSIFAAADLKMHHNITINKLYTFGMPRVGNQVFTTWFADNIIKESRRLVDGRDIVAHLPDMLHGYHHIPREIWQPNPESIAFMQCDNSGEDSSCSDNLLIYNVKDHLRYLGMPVGHRTCASTSANESANSEELLMTESELVGLERMARENSSHP